VTLINGAQACNVFWQVGSSATLGSGSVFVGNILALASISVNSSVTVHGRALARNAAVTLINDTFTKPTCAVLPSTGVTGGSGSTTTPADAGTGTTGTDTGTSAGGAGPTGTVTSGGGPGTTGTGTTGTTAGGTGTTGTRTRTPGAGGGTPGTATGIARPGGGTAQDLSRGGPGVPGVVGPPRTGAAPVPAETFPWSTVLFLGLFGGAEMLRTARGRRVLATYALPAER
jgi:hypothetical protein